MAGLPWLKVAVDFADHPKAFALGSRLSDPRAPLHLPAVWGHFARHYADGSMPDTDFAIRALERAALWTGEPGELVAALIDVGLLERRRKRIAVHGWEEWQEGHARKLERDRERMRAKRAKAREESRATVADETRDGRAGEGEREGDQDSSLRSELAPGADALAAPRRRRKPGAEPDPRHRPLQERLEAAFREERRSAYGFQRRDAKALTELLRLSNGDAAEVERRWRVGLGEVGFRRCDALHELAAKWNAYSGTSGAAPRRPVAAQQEAASPRDQLGRSSAGATPQADGWAQLEERIDAAGELNSLLQGTLGGCELRCEGQLLTARPRHPDVAAALEYYRAGLEREARSLGLGLRILEPARAAAAGGAP